MLIDTLNATQLSQVEEYFRCKNDLIYFIEHMIMLPAAGGDQLFKLYDRQKDYLNFVEKEKHTIILKSRQVGASTCIQAWCTWICTFFDNAVIGVVSKSGSESTDFCKKTGDMIDKLPEWIRPEFVKRTQQSFILKNGCQFHSAAVSPANPENLLRGKSLTVAIIDECAFINYMDRAMTGFAPALFKAQQTARNNGVPYGTVIISTPNRTTGTGKWYFDMWKKAEKGQAAYKPFKLHWQQIPEFANDPGWYQTQCAILGNVEWRIAQELNLEFVASSESFFDTETVRMLNQIDTQPMSTTIINGKTLKHFTVPDKNKFYLIGIDTASASGSDSSTIWVMDYETNQQAAEFQEKLRVDDFCPIIEQVCKIFPNNLIIPECNSYGNQVCEYLSRKGSYNLYQTKVGAASIGARNQQRYRYGLYTNPVNRPLIIDAMYTMVTEDINCVKSRNTALELISLIDYGNGKIAADEGEHDDLCMAFAFCCYVKLYDPPRTLISKSTSKEEKEFISDIMDWNNDEAGMMSMAPVLQKMNEAANGEEDPIKKNQIMNGVMRKFINTHLDELISQRADQNPNNDVGGSCINLLGIIDGTTNTSWIR